MNFDTKILKLVWQNQGGGGGTLYIAIMYYVILYLQPWITGRPLISLFTLITLKKIEFSIRTLPLTGRTHPTIDRVK
jgi:hypothetical protein